MKRKKNNYKIVLIIFIVVTIALFAEIGYLVFYKKDNEKSINNKEVNNQEVTDSNIDNNDNNIDNDIKDEPSNEEDEIINLLKQEEYYIENNLDRYLSYKALNPEKTNKEIITDVNCNIDKDFYTDIENSDLDKGILVIVNKYHALSSNYIPNLTTMENSYTSVAGAKMEVEAYEHFKEMVDAAKLEDIKLFNVSAYRSYATQDTLYTNYVKRDGVDGADRYSARPGHSEHQTGLASDINTASSKAHFENTKEYSWLISNSYKYGFILRYPENKEYLTGYKFEPWHYRYVGVEVATYIHEHNITYDEYYAYFIEK